MKSPAAAMSPAIRSAVAGLLTWLLPGSGHLFIGEKARGIILMATLAVTFWTGVAIGGVKNTVNPTDRWGWFLGQICAGGHTLTAMAWSRQLPDVASTAPHQAKASWLAYGREEEISVVYTGICGMLNILVIFDVLVRAERLVPVLVKSRAGPRSGRVGA